MGLTAIVGENGKDTESARPGPDLAQARGMLWAMRPVRYTYPSCHD
jgi:hypothetical protein